MDTLLHPYIPMFLGHANLAMDIQLKGHNTVIGILKEQPPTGAKLHEDLSR
jgi:hypothetical protein